MDNGLIKLLEEAGFSGKESAVYLALLELGQGTVARIAQVTKLKRPIIYVTLETLAKRGYVSMVTNKKIITYAVSDPSIISARLTTTAKHFLEMLPYLQTLGNKSGQRPHITYYDTWEGIWNVFKEASYSKDVMLVTSYARLMQKHPSATETWISGCERGVYSLQGWKHLVPNKPSEKEIVQRLVRVGQNVRTVTNDDLHSLDLAVYDKKISITAIDEQPFMVVIESDSLARSLRAMLGIIWHTGQQLENEKQKE